jgi:RES domain-containing protein
MNKSLEEKKILKDFTFSLSRFTKKAMKFYRITSCEFKNDLSGKGAYLYGGRWNNKDTHLLYTAEYPALAMLEALAHITMVRQKRDYCKMVIGHPKPAAFKTIFKDGKWYQEITVDQLPVDWRNSPGPDSLREMGDAFVREGVFLALKVPSVLEPDSFNYLFNTEHPAFTEFKVIHSELVSFDQRLLVRKIENNFEKVR